MSGRDDDFLDLPVAAPRTDVVAKTGSAQLPRKKTREEMILGAQTQMVADAGACAKILFDIWRIRESAAGDVARTAQETERLRVEFQGEVEKLRERRATLAERGRITVDILRAAQSMIRDVPEADRVKIFSELPGLIDKTLAEP